MSFASVRGGNVGWASVPGFGCAFDQAHRSLTFRVELVTEDVSE